MSPLSSKSAMQSLSIPSSSSSHQGTDYQGRSQGKKRSRHEKGKRKNNHSNKNNSNNDHDEEISKPRKRKRGSSSFSLTVNAIRSIATGAPIVQSNKDGQEKENKNSETSNLILKLRMEEEPVTIVTTNQSTMTASSETNNNENHQDDGSVFYATLGDGDGSLSLKVLVMDKSGELSQRISKEKARKKRYDWIVAIHGYVTTEKVWNVKYQLFPIICLTSISVLSTTKRKGRSSLGTPFSYTRIVSSKAHTGNIGTFLNEHLSFLTNEELAGSCKLLIEQQQQHQQVTAVPTTTNGTSSPTSTSHTHGSTIRTLFQETSSLSSTTEQQHLLLKITIRRCKIFYLLLALCKLCDNHHRRRRHHLLLPGPRRIQLVLILLDQWYSLLQNVQLGTPQYYTRRRFRNLQPRKWTDRKPRWRQMPGKNAPKELHSL